jgi:hypothetical protein
MPDTPKVLDQRRLESRGVDKHFGGGTLGNDKGIFCTMEDHW